MNADDEQALRDIDKEIDKEIEERLGNEAVMALQATAQANDMLTDNNRVLRQALHYLGIIAVVLAVVIVFALNKEPVYKYFYVNEFGDVFQTNGYDHPVVNKVAVANFAQHIATQLHTWTYQNYMDNFTGLFSVCKKEVVEEYYNALGNDGVFAEAERFKQRYEGTVLSKRVDQESVYNSSGAREWRVKLTLKEDIFGTNVPVSKTYEMIVQVKQVPLSVSYRGLQCTLISENFK